MSETEFQDYYTFRYRRLFESDLYCSSMLLPIHGMMPYVRLCIVVFGLCLLPNLFGGRPIQMKLLVLGATGDEPSLTAIQSALNHLGVPYDAVLLAKGQVLPPLDDGATGNYQGIILATGNLGVCDPACHSAMSTQDWARLDRYGADYSVRTASYYTFPEARFGLRFTDSLFVPLASPAAVTFAPAAAGVFPYLRQDHALMIGGAFAYLAEAAPGPGEVTIPLLRIGDAIAGALHTKPDGREYLALGMDQGPNLRHSQLLNYGVIAWVTRGVFLGSRKMYLSPQIDDLFLANNLFTSSGGSCTPTQFTTNPAQPPAPDCPKLRIGGTDLEDIRAWQAAWNAQPQTSSVRLTMAFNGFGAKPDGADDLTAEAQRSLSDFNWVSHTYSHKNLDCYAVASDGSCRPASADESLQEVRQNFDLAGRLGIPADAQSMITPAVSGLTNPDFLRAAESQGIRYLITDTSRPEGNPSFPNTGIRSGQFVLVPRRATNLFFDAVAPEDGAIGSETDAYDFFFGPNGVVRVGGVPDGAPFFATRQSWEQILDSESNSLLLFLMRYELYPCMFHQSNLSSYQNGQSMLASLLDLTFRKFLDLSNLPIVSLPQSTIGALLEERMNWLASGAKALLTPGESITIASDKATVAPITGVCDANCEQYGGESQSRVPVEAGVPVTIRLR